MDGKVKRDSELARKMRSQNARATPWLFPEYCRLIEAKKKLSLAEEEYKQAEHEWQRVLKGE